ncbi:hypothetical protein QTP70_020404, partial [Hemibagrus guttatus]
VPCNGLASSPECIVLPCTQCFCIPDQDKSDQLHPFMATVLTNDSVLFQQNNDPCHTAVIVQERFEEGNKEFKLLTWPPKFPDLNPIEHLWDVLDKQVKSMEVSSYSLLDLKDLLLKSWCQIPQHTFRGLVESMP